MIFFATYRKPLVISLEFGPVLDKVSPKMPFSDKYRKFDKNLRVEYNGNCLGKNS